MRRRGEESDRESRRETERVREGWNDPFLPRDRNNIERGTSRRRREEGQMGIMTGRTAFKLPPPEVEPQLVMDGGKRTTMRVGMMIDCYGWKGESEQRLGFRDRRSVGGNMVIGCA